VVVGTMTNHGLLPCLESFVAQGPAYSTSFLSLTNEWSPSVNKGEWDAYRET